MKELAGKMLKYIEKMPTLAEPYEDLFQLCRAEEEDHFTQSHELNKYMRDLVIQRVQTGIDSEKFYSLYRRSLLFDAPHFFDEYLQYLEINRVPKSRFYLPRRKVLKPIVDACQALLDDELDELFLSCPPRVGKTSLIVFLMTFQMGRNSEAPCLYSAYSSIITNSFYGAVLEVLTDKNTYTWEEIFPKVRIARTNAAESTIDMGRRKHYPTLTCRSIDGTLNGACDAQDGLIVGDDLVEGIEEALSKDRLVSKWNKVDNNLIPRGKGNTKYLWIGTRWSMYDPIGMRRELVMNDKKFTNHRYKIIDLPALNEKDESNFDYPYGVGFSTLYYHRRRASFEKAGDIVSWNAQYMCNPMERAGTLFSPQDFRYYNGELPEEEPDRIFFAIDPAYGGGDFCAGPVCYQYGDDIYIPDVIYCGEDKSVSQPLLVQKIEKFMVPKARFETTKTTDSYRQEVDAMLKEKGLHVTTVGVPAANDKSKQQRIFDKAPDIRQRMIFLDSGHRTREYDLFMQNVFSFKILETKSLQHKRHDDAPDSLAMAIDEANFRSVKVQALKRPF